MSSDIEETGGLETAPPFLPFSRPSITLEDIERVASVLRSGWITTGPVGAKFEEAFANRVGAAHAVAVTSATAGMHLLLHALGIGPGDEVVTPSMTWVSTVNLVTLAGAKPVFVDVDRDTLMVSAAQVETAISERTRLIIPVHFAGAPLDLGPLRALAEQRRIPMIEDAAHAAGASYRGLPIGQSGTAVFSLHPIKNLTAGEGGVVCTDDAALADRIRRLRFHGLGVDAYQREVQGRTPQAEVLEPGFKYNLPDMDAALALGQLERLDRMNEKRAALANRYGVRLADVDALRPLRVPDYPLSHAWHLYVVRLDTGRARMSRQVFMDALKRRGIGTGIHFRAVHQYAYHRRVHDAQDLPHTDWNSDRVCSLPLFPDMEAADVDRVVDAVRAVLAEAS